MMISVFAKVENIVGKGENAGYQHFSPFPTMFSKAFYFRIVNARDCVVRATRNLIRFFVFFSVISVVLCYVFS